MTMNNRGKNANGYRFEIWGERLLRQRGHYGVERNVLYHVKGVLTGKKRTRQVDLQYTKMLDMAKLNLASLVVIECKYRPACSNDVIKLEETRKIIGADRAELMLAKRPSHAVQDNAEKYNIKIYSPDDLRKYQVFKGKTLAQQVSGVRLGEYDHTATIMNLRSMFWRWKKWARE